MLEKDMTSTWVWSLISVLIVGVVSLGGLVILYFSLKELNKVIFFLISLAVGALFGDAFIHLLPEIYHQSSSPILTSSGFLIGIILFFILEKFLRSHHHHAHHEGQATIEPVGPINMVSDSIHNFIDGALIAASFMASREVGIATALAVLLHEIPHEIGDYGVLIHAGFSRTQALLFNAATALLAFAGAIVTLAIGVEVQNFVHIVLPIATGGFIYIAGSDLVPELHRDNRFKTTVTQLSAILIGIALMFGLLIVG